MTDADEPLDFEDEELLRRAGNWSPEMRARVAKEVDDLVTGKKRQWYCNRGRACDGKEHEGYPYRHARGDQWPPPGIDWLLWLALSGRGAGKTRTGSEWVKSISKYVPRVAAIGRRGPDVRQTMIEGDSGLIKACENAGLDYEWMPSKKEFTFGNGCVVMGFSAEEPDTLRGPQFGAAWLDEPCHYDLIDDVWDNLSFGLRTKGLPGGVKVYASSTPLPSEWLDARIADASTRLMRVSTYANIDNLDEAYRKLVIAPYEGTRKGRQELYGEILRDVPGALWDIDMMRPLDFDTRDMERIIVAIDPAGTANRKSDKTGIVVAGKIGDEYYVIEDRTDKYSPSGWANAAIDAYLKYQADAIIAEKNFGADMVRTTIQHELDRRDELVRVLTRQASRGKEVRAEPVVNLYEQKRVYHARGLEDLEKEMCSWVPGKGASPNRVDALVWSITELAKLGSSVGAWAGFNRRPLGRSA